MPLNSPNQKVVFPGEASSIIQKLVEKYGLKEKEKKDLERMTKAKSFKEREEIFENLPGRIIAKAVREVAEGEINLKDLPPALEEIFGISRAEASKLTKELGQRILILARKIPVEKEVAEIPGSVKPPPVSPTKPVSKEKPHLPKKPKKKDVYREPIE